MLSARYELNIYIRLCLVLVFNRFTIYVTMSDVLYSSFSTFFKAWFAIQMSTFDNFLYEICVTVTYIG